MFGSLGRYNPEIVTEAVRHPKLAFREASRIATAPLRRRAFRREHGHGCDIMSRDWDNLLILDACRFDIFKQINSIPGDLDFVISKGSHSREFYRKNFQDRLYNDTVAVSANPYTPTMAQNSFFDLQTTFGEARTAEEKSRVDTIETDDGHTMEATHVDNVDPGRLNELAMGSLEQHPNKRLIVHYMQPHDPYLGETAADIRDSFGEDGYRFRYWADADSVSDDDPNGLMALATDGQIAPEQMKNVYKENLRIVLRYIEELLSKVGGKSVITSDHGELLGERVGSKRFFHYNEMYVEELRKVPWLVVDSTDRRKVTAETPVSEDTVDKADIDEHLELLGYK